MIGIILVAKQLFKKHLSSRMQYNLWFIMITLLVVPFLPIGLVGYMQIFSWLTLHGGNTSFNLATANQSIASTTPQSTLNWINDFTISVTKEETASISVPLFCIWILGIFAMILLTRRSYLQLRRIEHSALPLQNKNVYRMFIECKRELGICKNISIYSTAYIVSPFTVGIICPRIYLPIPFISDYNETDCRFMLLHELQHYKHRDSIVNLLMNLANIVYWFNPFVWYALKEMRNDREIACDSSVLNMLDEQDYIKYGETLINFAEKISYSFYSITSGISGNMKQIKKRIVNIASYQTKTPIQKLKGICSYFLIAFILFQLAPILSVYATGEDVYQLKEQNLDISYIDLSSYFDDYQGCFVLYDSSTKSWKVYNKSTAQKRVSPDSTYKIYSALFGLENAYIAPTSTTIRWSGQEYPFTKWNMDQNLKSAFQNSVNWYFQALDQSAGLDNLENFYTHIDYGNHDLSGGISNFWLESSLKISPLEQVELLNKFYTNEFNFKEQNIQTVKNALLLSSNSNGKLYGKTGTGNINGQNINGWFIGFVETPDTIYFFATNIHNTSTASGSTASKITLKILNDQNIYIQTK